MTEPRKHKTIYEMTPAERAATLASWSRRDAVYDKLRPLEERKRELEDEREELGHRLALVRRDVDRLERREREVEEELERIEGPIQELERQYRELLEAEGLA